MPKYSLLMLLVFAIPSPAHAEDLYFNSNGCNIRYVSEGKGEPVILIHGWMSDSSMWGGDLVGNTKLKPLDGFRLIALDCRGHGKSDKPHDPARYGVEMANDVIRLLDHLKLDKAHLIGYSSGSFIAGHVAANHPDRIISVIYGGQAPIIAGKIKPTDFSECEGFAKAVDEGKGLGSYIISVSPASKPKPTIEQANAIARFLYGNKDVKAFALAGCSFKELAVSEDQLKKCPAPILFIHGGNESAHVKNRVAMVHQLLGRGEVKLVEGRDHISTLTKPEFGTTIVAFLKAHKQNKPPK